MDELRRFSFIFWSRRIEVFMKQYHLALFTPGYIGLILDGYKTIESRFSIIKCAPYNKVEKGDVVYMKVVGGAIEGIFSVGEVETYTKLKRSDVRHIDNKYRYNIFCDPTFGQHLGRWNECSYATIMHIDKYMKFFKPAFYENKGRSAWKVLEGKLSLDNQRDRFYDL